MLVKHRLMQGTEELDNSNIYPYTKKRNSREQGTRKCWHKCWHSVHPRRSRRNRLSRQVTHLCSWQQRRPNEFKSDTPGPRRRWWTGVYAEGFPIRLAGLGERRKLPQRGTRPKTVFDAFWNRKSHLRHHFDSKTDTPKDMVGVPVLKLLHTPVAIGVLVPTPIVDRERALVLTDETSAITAIRLQL